MEQFNIASDYMDKLNRFMTTANPTDPPEFFTPNGIVFETDVLLLRVFRMGERYTMIVPPCAGHHSSIADYKGASLVQTTLDSTDDGVMCVEWKASTQATKDTTINDLITELHNVMEKDTHIVGLCQGGWVAAIYTSMHQDMISKLTIAGTPIDAHAQGGDLQEIVQALPQSVYEMLVMLGGGNMSGDTMLSGWKAGNFWDRYLIDYMKIWNAIDDQSKLDKIKQFRRWYEFPQDIPGAWYLEAVQNIFRDNLLPTGEMMVGDNKIDLKNITCPTVCIVGDKDDITLEEQCTNLHKFTSSTDKKVYKIKGVGHVGIYMSKRSLPVWAESLKE